MYENCAFLGNRNRNSKSIRPTRILTAAALGLALVMHAAAGVLYVDLKSASPAPPYNTWATAATNIQDAVDAALPGDQILVTNGIYQTGGRAVAPYLLTNRVAVTKPVSLQSVNGPAVTVIQGYQMPGVTNGDSAIRCVYLTNGTSLTGFTLTNGATRTAGDSFHEQYGGGLLCEALDSSVTNCVFARNAASYAGGGVFNGTLIDCILTGNSAISGFGEGGGADSSVMTNCLLTGNSANLLGGGAAGGTLDQCQLFNNSAFYGGGASSAVLLNSLIVSNNAAVGGGVVGGNLTNCTIAGNLATSGGGGVFNLRLINCITYSNTAPTNANYDPGVSQSLSSFYFCCTTPMPTNGVGNITNAPLFVDFAGGNFRLQSNSPCINAGTNNIPAGPDLDGNPRIVGGTVDLGAYEFQNSASIISYAWLQQYGLPTDGSADFLDTNHDGMNNWQEWRAGTDPTNPSSVLSLLSPTLSGTNLIVTWQSATNHLYYLQRATNLTALPVFLPLATNLTGHTGTTSYTDTTVTNNGPYYYRVGVQ